MINRLLVLPMSLLALTAGRAIGQDVMSLHVRQLAVLAEDADVRVLRYAPRAGERVPMHSHPRSVVYVLKGGRVRYTFPDGSTRDALLKTGDTLLRPPVTHSDEAIDALESILIEMKH